MGLCISSAELHEAERAMRLKPAELVNLEYCEQPDDDVLQLDTENDQRGSVAVEHLYKKIRDVYGQPPRDLRHKIVDFGEHVVIKTGRPSPYDFPAFEHEKLLNDANDRLRLSQEVMSREDRKSRFKKSIAKSAQNAKGAKPSPKQSSREVTAKSTESKSKSKVGDNKSLVPPTVPKISHNEALDHCSLEDE
ncbi:hypothetical protein L596_008562 [Steinernema carpocapsae]|uniref:Uncharacterized protein n=1 Tax=Steinernema carpocapsae TaxID=34508 RepID=A0A4U5PDD3_STECR|nr:hypothetical protein L596_008562 [Steinernema carpocapsae]